MEIQYEECVIFQLHTAARGSAEVCLEPIDI